MASVTTTSKNMPKLVMAKLLRMRSKLTRWILIHGLGRWLIAILAVLAFDVALDRFFKMDFAQRLVMLIAMAIAAAVYFGIRVLKPLLSRLSDDALIYEVESKNPRVEGEFAFECSAVSRRRMETMGNFCRIGGGDD